MYVFFFFSSRRRHTRSLRDWSSDVCSSDLRSAVADIARIEELAATDEPITSLYRPLEAPEGMVRLKLFSSGGVLLSEVLPTLEHLGAKVADERPYEITPADGKSAWIYDFGLQADPANT